jgi:DNA polymerase III alpha subunit
MSLKRYVGDVDIDFADRNKALRLLEHTPASIIRNGKIDKHNTGVYFHVVPVDPVTGYASMHYEQAEGRGWYKIDLLNVGVYEKIKDESHLIALMEKDLDWSLLQYKEFTSRLIHVGNHSELVATLKPSSIMDVAIVLALIRPGKRHLVDKCKSFGFESISNEIWTESADGYTFKKAHAVGYAMLVKVHANLIVEEATDST